MSAKYNEDFKKEVVDAYYNTFKNCFYYRFTFDSVEMLDKMTKQYINWYNYVRPILIITI